MCQPRGAVAGGLIQDLDNCSVMAVDCEDRRYCFQITTPTGKAYETGFIWGQPVTSALSDAVSCQTCYNSKPFWASRRAFPNHKRVPFPSSPTTAWRAHVVSFICSLFVIFLFLWWLIDTKLGDVIVRTGVKQSWCPLLALIHYVYILGV